MRSSGILMHITSLPGPYGVGTMGKQAFAFVDFLKDAGQRLWQILPLTPTGFGDSPYQSCSTFAGNHYLIDLDFLVEDGLLDQEEITGIRWCRKEEKADFGLLYNNRLKVLRLAYSRFGGSEAFDAFCDRSSAWLPDFALFMALKERYGGKPWYEWPEDVKHRRADAMAQAREELAQEIRFYSFVQYLFFTQWEALHGYANECGIQIIGDVPIYVPLDSVEVWSQPQLFELDKKLNPIAVAGCPPDGFTEDGPGMSFVKALKKGLPDLPLIAEDLGFLTQEVLDLRDAGGWPGMKVLQFAFDPKEPSDYLPHTYVHNSVCYTGTHDNMTMRQWFETASKEEVEFAAAYMNLSKKEGYVWGTIRTALASVSDLCVIQLQDYLNLDGKARMNFPGTLSDSNWTWRAKDGIITKDLAKKIRELTRLYARI